MVGNTGSITFGGLASGIDTNAIIDQLMMIERRPIALAQNRLNSVQMRSEAFSRISSALSGLLTRSQALANPETFRARATSVLAKEADANKVQATASAGAAVGAYALQVTALATSTRAASVSAVGQAIDAGAPMDQAGWGGTLQPGTFTINGATFTIHAATATRVASAASVGPGFDPKATLDSAGLDAVPASGTFEVDGTSINFDASTDTLEDVIRYINASSAGVTASYDADTESLVFTHDTAGSGQAITLEDTGGTFLEAFRLVDGAGAPIGTVTTGTDVRSLEDLMDEVNHAGIGVTMSIEDDAWGRPNLLRVASAVDVQLGSGADTSNFLSLTSLLQSPPGATRTSQRGLGAVSRTDDLQDARLAVALTQTAGAFTVNGVEVAYDATNDSLANVITRINNSDAGVTVTYDTFTDTLTATSNAAGALAIQFEDVEGNLLAALGLVGTTQTMGQNAAYTIDGGPTRYATSNTISDAIDGVTLTLHDTTTEAVRVTVAQQGNAASQAMDAFVKEFNAVLDLMGQFTAYNEGGNNGILFGDGTVRRIQQGLRSMVTRAVEGVSGGLRTLSDVGVSFGAVGSAVGTANRLAFNPTKFADAMKDDPEAVAQLLTIFTATASLTAGGTGALAAVSGTPTAATRTGRYNIASTAGGTLQATFQPDDGSAPIVTTGTIAAGGVNTTLIPGVTLTAHSLLADGTDQVVIGASSQGFAKAVTEWVESLTRSGGLLEGRNEEMSKVVTDINSQIERLEARVLAREEQLVKRFTAMELTISRLQSQQQALTQMQAQLAGLNQQRR